VPDVNPEGLRFLCRSGNWGVFKDRTTLSGCGISALLSVHAENHGALTLSRFRQTSQFDSSAWDALWNTDLGEPASALLSVDIADNTDVVLGWLIVALNGTSREWSSHDRDLAEEIALLLAVAMKRAIL
jgi:GAF domain-containing protein